MLIKWGVNVWLLQRFHWAQCHGTLNCAIVQTYMVISLKILHFMWRLTLTLHWCLHSMEKSPILLVKLKPEIVLRGIRWTIMTERLLDFYIISLMANKDDIHINWATNVTVTITLLSNSKETSRTSTKVYTFDWRNSVKSLEIIEWDEFMDLDNKFVENDAAIFRVELSVAPPKPLWNIDF